MNGRITTELGTKISPGLDKVVCDGKPVTAPSGFVYLMLHKPAGVLTSLSDPRGRPVIGDLLPAQGLPRLFPVGRLDYQTEGLVLLTNDGALAHGLMHPSFEVQKEYLAKVQGCPTPDDLVRLKAGVISDGERLWATHAEITRHGIGSAWLKLVVHQGRYHEIRRMCDVIGHPVLRLQRVRVGPVVLGKLPKGSWRRLSPAELADIRRVCLGIARRQAMGPNKSPVAGRAPTGRNVRVPSPASPSRRPSGRVEKPSSGTRRSPGAPRVRGSGGVKTSLRSHAGDQKARGRARPR